MRMINKKIYLGKIILLFLILLGCKQTTANDNIKWRNCLEQTPEWYGSDEAIRIADNVLLYQTISGGWPKNIDMAEKLSEDDLDQIKKRKSGFEATIDNSATYTQIRFLTKVFNKSKLERFKNSLLKGIDYLFEAQYENGGWPQFYPLIEGYYTHITFNDNAMINVMRLLKDVADNEQEFTFIDQERKNNAKKSVEKGIECILKCQVIIEGKLTVWCAQHDEHTLKPAQARTYEHPSLSGYESAEIVSFLTEIENPSPEIINSIISAIDWFKEVEIKGIRLEIIQGTFENGRFDYKIVKDSKAPPMWARFYEIGTNRPIFSGRDGIIKYDISEIEQERRMYYSWLGYYPSELLTKIFPAWLEKHN